MQKYSCERIGYFSIINGKLVDPVFTSLNVEAIQKINQSGRPLDGNYKVPMAKNTDTVAHLIEYLEKENILTLPLGHKEFNVISRATTLRRLLVVYVNGKETPFFSFYKYPNENTTVIEQRNNDNDDIKLTGPGEVVETLLALFTDGKKEKIFGSTKLFIVVKHRYIYSNDIIINLFVSKEIHSVIRKNNEIIPLDLKPVGYYALASDMQAESLLWRHFILNFLGGCPSHFMAVGKNQYFDRVILLDNTNALCDNMLVKNFKKILPIFLKSISRLNEGELTKLPPVEKKKGYLQEIQMCVEPGRWFRLFDSASTSVGIRNVYSEFEKAEHELVILGSHKLPIPYSKHFYNADFMSLQNFYNEIYSTTDILRKPKSIKFYGTLDEYDEVQCFMDDEQLGILSFIESND